MCIYIERERKREKEIVFYCMKRHNPIFVNKIIIIEIV